MTLEESFDKKSNKYQIEAINVANAIAALKKSDRVTAMKISISNEDEEFASYVEMLIANYITDEQEDTCSNEDCNCSNEDEYEDDSEDEFESLFKLKTAQAIIAMMLKIESLEDSNKKTLKLLNELVVSK